MTKMIVRSGSINGATAFLDGGGEAARLIRERDWTGHPLGRPETWGEGLCAALSLMVNSPESMILCWGPELTFFFNETYFPLLGPRLSWAMGARMDEVWADAWDQAKPIIDEAFAGRSMRYVDLPWKLDTDRGVADTWWSFSYSRILDRDGEIAGLFIFTNETTARVLADQQRDAAEARFRLERERVQLALAAGAIIGTWVWDLPNDRFTVDERFAVTFGLDPTLGRDGLPLEQIIATVHPDDRDGLIAAIDEVIARGGAYAHQYRVRRADGRFYWIEANGRVDLAEDGTPLRFPGVLLDVEERRKVTAERDRALAELRRLNEDLERRVEERTVERDRMWNTSPDLMVVLSNEGIYRDVNPAWMTVLGYAPEEVIGLYATDLAHPDDIAASAAAFETAQGAALPSFENRFRHKDGSYRWIQWVAAPSPEEIFAVGRHITAAKEAERRLRETEDALRQAQKMEAVGQLTGGIAHDFNNMLAVVIGSLDLAMRRLGAGETRLRRYLDAATEGARRAANLTQRLLAFSRQQPLQPEPIDIGRLIRGMYDLLRHSLGSDIAFETILPADLWRTHADPNQLENVILNLAVNSRDAMPDGGRLLIEARNAEIDDRPFALIAVSDTGAGMSPEVIARAFDPFFTTKEVGRGTGLGLSQVYGFVNQSGGHVSIRSTPGEGTTVSVCLPRLIGGADAPDAAAAPDMPFASHSELILVVEDEPAVRQLSVDALSELGYRVLEAPGAASALPLLDTHPDIDLLFTDIVMPETNGKKLADAARVRRPDLKVLFTTGYMRDAVAHHGVLDAGVDLIGKPYTIEQLAAKVREVLDRR